jgi:hypothetical protein
LIITHGYGVEGGEGREESIPKRYGYNLCFILGIGS